MHLAVQPPAAPLCGVGNWKQDLEKQARQNSKHQGRVRGKAKGVIAGMCFKKQEARKHSQIIGKKRKKKSKVAEYRHIKKEGEKKCVVSYSKCLKMKKSQNRTMAHSSSRRRTELREK